LITHNLRMPLDSAVLLQLRAGDRVVLSGVMYAARDSAHKRMIEALGRGERLPVDLAGQVIYYMGPTPVRPGRVFGAAGPTTAGRMDPYTPQLLSLGLKGTIGKGRRSAEVRAAMMKNGAVYFAAVGGAGALLSRHIVAARVAAYEDLGPEAMYELEVDGFPAVVIDDLHGADAYELGRELYRRDWRG
jgi:fumarate hydratase subunit beta